MKIVREQRDGGSSLLRIKVGETDYAQEVEKALRDYRRKANIPGFRPGMVPMGIVKKMYGKGVVAEQSYRMASNAAFDYLQKEKIDYLATSSRRTSRAVSTSRTARNSSSSSSSAKLPKSSST